MRHRRGEAAGGKKKNDLDSKVQRKEEECPSHSAHRDRGGRVKAVGNFDTTAQ